MGDKMKVYARMWKAALEKIRVNESIGKATVNKNSGDIGRLTETESWQEIEQNSEELCGLTENKSSQEIGENSGEMGDLTERKNSQEIGESSGKMGGLIESKLSQEIEQNSGENGDLAERKFSQEIGESSGQIRGLTESKLSQEMEEIPDAADSSASTYTSAASSSSVVAVCVEKNTSPASSSVVAVCVEKNSEHAVRWALDNLVSDGGQLTLIYARRPIVAVPTPMGNYLPIALASSDAVAAEMEKVASQTANLIWPLQQLCHSQKVQTVITLLEDHNIPRAILKHISESGINKLVIMSSNPLVKRNPKGHDKGHDSWKLKRDNSMKPKGNDKGHDSRKLNSANKDLTGDDMLASTAMKPSKSCFVYVISKGKVAKINRSNSSARDSSSSSDDTFLSGDMTGRKILDPIQTTINNVNGNQIVENNGKDFEGSFRSKPDIGSNLGRLWNGLQPEGKTYREAIAFEEAFAANENGNQNIKNNKSDFEDPSISKPDTKTTLEKLKIEFQHTGERYREAIAFEEAIVASENGSQNLENNRRNLEGSSISKKKLASKVEREFCSATEWQTVSCMQPDIGSNLGSLRTGLQPIEEQREEEAIALEKAVVANENGNQNIKNNKRDFEVPSISKPDIKSKLEKLKTDLQPTETQKEAIAFEEAIVTNENGNQKFENENNKRDFQGLFISRPETKTTLEKLKIEFQHTGETYREAIAFVESIVSSENGSQNLENKRSFKGSFISQPDMWSKLERSKTTGKTYQEAMQPDM